MIIERNIQQSRISVECLDDYSQMGSNVLQSFASLADSGQALTPGTQLRFGWSLLRLQPLGEGLRICEPNFVHLDEQRWNTTINVTLHVLALQTRLLRRVGLQGEDVFHDQLIVATPGALRYPNVFLRRTPPSSANDSGWSLGRLDDPEELQRAQSLETFTVASLVEARDELLQVLTLPVDCIVVFHDGTLHEVFDPRGRELLRGPESA